MFDQLILGCLMGLADVLRALISRKTAMASRYMSRGMPFSTLNFSTPNLLTGTWLE